MDRTPPPEYVRMPRITRYGFLGFLSVMVVVFAALVWSPVDASAQDEAPLPENSGESPDVPEPPAATDPPPLATQPPPPATEPPPPATELPPPPATDPPAATEPPATPTEATSANPPATTGTAPVTEVPTATGTATPVGTETPEPAPDVVDPVPSDPPPAALGLPSPLPGPIGLVPGGAYNGLAAIWNYAGHGISQDFGRTSFSVAHPTWYVYGVQYGLDGISHPGLDISMPRGTWLYSPVTGTVVVSGNSAGFTFHGNGNAGVGELRIRTSNGDEVILGHMGRIAVYPGDYVTIGEFVGVSGGFNGDHLHVEARQSGRIVDPRYSFITATIEAALQQPEADTSETVPDEVLAGEEAVEVESGDVPAGEQPSSIGEESTAVSGDEPADGVVASSPLTASLQDNAQRAGTWVQGMATVEAEEKQPPEKDDVAAGLVETARLQPLLTLVPSPGGSTEEPESEPAG